MTAVDSRMITNPNDSNAISHLDKSAPKKASYKLSKLLQPGSEPKMGRAKANQELRLDQRHSNRAPKNSVHLDMKYSAPLADQKSDVISLKRFGSIDMVRPSPELRNLHSMFNNQLFPQNQNALNQLKFPDLNYGNNQVQKNLQNSIQERIQVVNSSSSPTIQRNRSSLLTQTGEYTMLSPTTRNTMKYGPQFQHIQSTRFQATPFQILLSNTQSSPSHLGLVNGSNLSSSRILMSNNDLRSQPLEDFPKIYFLMNNYPTNQSKNIRSHRGSSFTQNFQLSPINNHHHKSPTAYFPQINIAQQHFTPFANNIFSRRIPIYKTHQYESKDIPTYNRLDLKVAERKNEKLDDTFSRFWQKDLYKNPNNQLEEQEESSENSIESNADEKSTISLEKKLKSSAENKSLLRTYCWAILYAQLAIKNTYQVAKRNKLIAQNSMIDNFNPSIQYIQNLIATKLQKELDALYSDSRSFVITNGLEKGLFGKKKVSDRQINERVNKRIFVHIKAIMNKFTNCLKQEDMSKEFLTFLVSISQNHMTPSDDFLTDFEIKRLTFSHFGTLKNMKDIHSKMIIGMFILIRVLVYQFFICPWTELKHLNLKIPSNNRMKNNLLTIGSIMYHTTLGIFRSSASVVPHNQDYLANELRVEPAISLVAKDENKEKEEESPKNGSEKEEEVIKGLLSENELSGLYKTNRKA